MCQTEIRQTVDRAKSCKNLQVLCYSKASCLSWIEVNSICLRFVFSFGDLKTWFIHRISGWPFATAQSTSLLNTKGGAWLCFRTLDCSGYHTLEEPAVGVPTRAQRHGWLQEKSRAAMVLGHPSMCCTPMNSWGWAHLLYQNHPPASLLASFTSLLARQGWQCTPSSLTHDLQLRNRQAPLVKQKQLFFFPAWRSQIYTLVWATWGKGVLVLCPFLMGGGDST